MHRLFGRAVAAMVGLVALQAPLAAEPVKLRVTLQSPMASHIGKNLQQFSDEVASRTKGQLAFEFFDSSQLYRDDEAVQAVATGKIEMGVVLLNQFAEQIPAVDIFQQPFMFNYDSLVKAATNPDREIRQLIDKAILKATGTRVLWWQAYGSTDLFSKGRDATSPDRFANTKVRTFGRTVSEFTQHCGGTPLIVSATKQRDAVKDGTVDMAMTGISGVQVRELWQVTDTITRTENAAMEFLVYINEGVWQRLNDEQRQIIGEVARKVEAELRDSFIGVEADAYTFAREKGMKVLELTPDQVVQWRACSAPVLENFMANSGDLGRQLMMAYAKLRADPCCNAGPAGAFSLR